MISETSGNVYWENNIAFQHVVPSIRGTEGNHQYQLREWKFYKLIIILIN